MSVVFAIWRANLTAFRHASRIDGRLRMAVVFMLLLESLLGLWSGQQLLQRIEQWQAAGQIAIADGLWTLCLFTWLVMGLISLVEGLQRGFGDDQSLLLFTQPIAPAMRFRALYGLFFIGRLWNWLLLEVGVTGVAMVIPLGWQGLLWLLLLQLGVACAVLWGLFLSLLATLLILPRRRVRRYVLLVLVLLMFAGVVTLWQVWPEVAHSRRRRLFRRFRLCLSFCSARQYLYWRLVRARRGLEDYIVPRFWRCRALTVRRAYLPCPELPR